MGNQRRKKKKRAKGPAGPATGGGGMMQGMVRGFRGVVGVEKKKSSTLGNVIWGLLLLAMVAFLIYRYTQ